MRSLPSPPPPPGSPSSSQSYHLHDPQTLEFPPVNGQVVWSINRFRGGGGGGGGCGGGGGGGGKRVGRGIFL